MAVSFACFALWFLWKRNYSWLGAVVISQVPFWFGLTAFMVTGEREPASLNLAANLMVAGAFIHLGEMLRASGRGGVVHVWLCLLFLVAATIDILQVVYPIPIYVLSQEIMHYLALMIIGGRAYVRVLDGNRRNSRSTFNSGKGGGLV